MDGDVTPLAIYEVHKADIERELTKPGSRARDEREDPLRGQVQEHREAHLADNERGLRVGRVDTMRTSCG